MKNERYRAVTVEDGLAGQEPLALAFDAVFKIVGKLPPTEAFSVLANVIAYGLTKRSPEQRTETLAEFNVMVLECIAANDQQTPRTMQ